MGTGPPGVGVLHTSGNTGLMPPDPLWAMPRELANVVEHATILCDQPPITAEHLPRHFDSRRLRSSTLKLAGPVTLREIEMQAILNSVERHEGNKPRAAEELGISLKTLYNKLNQAESMDRAA